MKDDTLLIAAGRQADTSVKVVNPPVYHASTVIFPTLEAFKSRGHLRYTGITYGLQGNPTRFALAEAVAALEGGHKTIIVSTGLAAVTHSLTAFCAAGGHVLVPDSVYEPTRVYCTQVLARFGVETTFYDPRAGAAIEPLIRPTTQAIFLESPGSLTFEVQDVPAITALARKRGIVTILDNTWASPLYFKALRHGVDISIQSATKYIGGHSDLLLGTITVGNEEHFRRVKDMTTQLGDAPGPDDCHLALRGLRTLAVRLRQHGQSALAVARWLQSRPEVARVLYPALPEDPGHALWRRDFTGASGLFGVLLRTDSEAAVSRMVDGLAHFKIGASWGGFESLVIPAYPAASRTVIPWSERGFLLRLHIGLEDPDDLIADLAAGLGRLERHA